MPGTQPSARLRGTSRRLTQGDIQLARGMQQEGANDDRCEPAGLRRHLRSSLVLLRVVGRARCKAHADM